MLNVLFLCFTIISISYGSPVGEIEGKVNSTMPEPNNKLQANNRLHVNNTKLAIASEGGAIISNTPSLSLPKDNQAFLMTSPADISSNNKVKPRKGAPVEGSENISLEKNPTITVNDEYVKNNTVKNITINDTKLFTNVNVTTLQPIIKKPPIVSVELIEKADLLNSDPAVDDVDEHVIKIHTKNSNGHPGMITPIIITVLVVPIFAMIGYMALKRGQEAWKNRHYKRMDFLLDGMYND